MTKALDKSPDHSICFGRWCDNRLLFFLLSCCELSYKLVLSRTKCCRVAMFLPSLWCFGDTVSSSLPPAVDIHRRNPEALSSGQQVSCLNILKNWSGRRFEQSRDSLDPVECEDGKIKYHIELNTVDLAHGLVTQGESAAYLEQELFHPCIPCSH